MAVIPATPGTVSWSLPTCASAAVVGLLWLACFRCGPGCYGLPVLVLLGGVVGTTLSSLLRSEVYKSASRFDAASFSPDPPYNGLITAHAVFFLGSIAKSARCALRALASNRPWGWPGQDFGLAGHDSGSAVLSQSQPGSCHASRLNLVVGLVIHAPGHHAKWKGI